MADNIDSQAICECGHNFASHQLCEIQEIGGRIVPHTLAVDINKSNIYCRHSEDSIPDCGCKGFKEAVFTSFAEKKRFIRQKNK